MNYLRNFFLKGVVVILIYIYISNKMFNNLISFFKLPGVGIVLGDIIIILFFLLLVLILIMRFFLKYDFKEIKKLTSKYILYFLNIYFSFSLVVAVYLKVTASFILYILILVLILLLFFSKDRFQVLKITLIILLIFNILIGYDFINRYNKEIAFVNTYFCEIIENKKPKDDLANLYTKDFINSINYKEHFYKIRNWFIRLDISKKDIKKSYSYLIDEWKKRNKQYVEMHFYFGEEKSIGVILEITNNNKKIDSIIIPEYN